MALDTDEVAPRIDEKNAPLHPADAFRDAVFGDSGPGGGARGPVRSARAVQVQERARVATMMFILLPGRKRTRAVWFWRTILPARTRFVAV